jgi:hypothetical protein
LNPISCVAANSSSRRGDRPGADLTPGQAYVSCCSVPCTAQMPRRHCDARTLSRRTRNVLAANLLTVLVPAMAVPACGGETEADRIGHGGGTGQSGAGSVSGWNSGGDTTGGDPRYSEPPCEPPLDHSLACSVQTAEATYTPVNVLLVADKSASMAQIPPGIGTDPWTRLKSALGELLPRTAELVRFGLIVFPAADCADGTCCEVPASVTVPIETGSAAAQSVLSVLDGVLPAGRSPAAAALARALEYFTAGAGSSLAGDKYVLLATDGDVNCGGAQSCDASQCRPETEGSAACVAVGCCDQPGGGASCLDDTNTLAEIDLLRSAGVGTFVLGVPATEEAARSLDQFALAGGQSDPNSATNTGHFFYEVDPEGEIPGLAEALDTITKHLVTSCDMDLNWRYDRDLEVHVFINCAPVRPESDGGGWTLTGGDASEFTSLTFTGSTCSSIQADGVRRVDVIIDCFHGP